MINKRTTLALIGIVALILIGFFYFASTSSPSDTNAATRSAPQSSGNVQQAQDANINLKSRCADDGRNFAENYEQTNSSQNAIGAKPLWFDPQYHFNARLNTCLVHIAYTQNTKTITAQDLFSSDFTDEVMFANVVFDIYSNQAILQSLNHRVGAQGKITDTPYKDGIYRQIPNLDENTFRNQLSVLMSE